MPKPTTGPAAAGPTVGALAEDAAATGAQIATTTVVSAFASPAVGRIAGVAVGAAARSRPGRTAIAILAAVLVATISLGALLTAGFITTAVSAVAGFMSGGGAAAYYAQTQANCYGSGTLSLGSGTQPGSVVLSAAQTENLGIIIEQVQARGLPASDVIIAVMTAFTESSLNNQDKGDAAGPDSRGLFQQRDPWGPYEVRMDPAGATNLFLDSLTSPDLKVYRTNEPVNVLGPGAGRPYIAPWLVAQSVQRSAFSDGSNYRQNYEVAVQLVSTTLSPEEIETANVDYWSNLDTSDTVSWADRSLLVDRPVVYCNNQLSTGSSGTGPAAWGGYENGRIPLDALSPIPWAAGQHLRSDAAAALIALNEEYRARFSGSDIVITDSYRSYDSQVQTKANKGYLAATPGTSNHGWGLALDLGGGINRWDTDQRNWMVENAPRYGWVSPAWAQPRAAKPEPWHWEFTGVPE